jgi:peptide deformylase
MKEPKLLRRTYFGNPILRETAKRLSKDEILSDEIQQLIKNIKYTVDKRKYGVGLAAPQVGVSIALALIAIKPTPTRPDRKIFNKVIINPEIIETYGNKKGMWEGCISYGSGTNFPYGQTKRYKKIKVSYVDEYAKKHTEVLEGFIAHVFQHETDHLNGILFVDRVTDNTTFITASEYRKRIVPTLPKDD